MKEKTKVSHYYTNQMNPHKSDHLLNYQIKKNIIKPPFKKGLYSYKQSYNYNNSNINNNNFFSYEPPNYSVFNVKKDKNHILNILPIEPVNSSLSFSSLNLNKYKIYNIPKNNNKSESQQQISNDSNGFIKNINLSMNMNNNNLINNNNNNLINNYINNEKNIKLENPKLNIEFHDYFHDGRTYEKESRRMIIELFKLHLMEKNNGNNGIKQLLKDNKISLRVLNQKMTKKEYESEMNNNLSNYNTNNNKEVFGEAKKLVYLKNLDSYLSQNSTITTEILTNNNDRKFNLENNILFNKNKRRINILNFLLTPRVLNLIEANMQKQKYVFLISLAEIFYLEGKESYIFQWKNMENNEVENEFNIKIIKKCDENKIFKNRFYIKVEQEYDEEDFVFEIETPSDEICRNYVIGINYLLNK